MSGPHAIAHALVLAGAGFVSMNDAAHEAAEKQAMLVRAVESGWPSGGYYPEPSAPFGIPSPPARSQRQRRRDARRVKRHSGKGGAASLPWPKYIPKPRLSSARGIPSVVRPNQRQSRRDSRRKGGAR